MGAGQYSTIANKAYFRFDRVKLYFACIIIGHTLTILASYTLESLDGDFFLKIFIGIELEGVTRDGVSEISFVFRYSDQSPKVLFLIQGGGESDGERIVFALILKQLHHTELVIGRNGQGVFPFTFYIMTTTIPSDAQGLLLVLGSGDTIHNKSNASSTLGCLWFYTKVLSVNSSGNQLREHLRGDVVAGFQISIEEIIVSAIGL